MTEPKRRCFPRNQSKLLHAAESSARSIYQTALREHHTHTMILKRIGVLYSSQNGVLAPQSYLCLCHYVRGLAEFLNSMLEWKVYHDGVHKLSSNVPPNDWLKVEAKKGAHFYPNSNDRFD